MQNFFHFFARRRALLKLVSKGVGGLQGTLFHNNSDVGLNELIAGVLSKPLP